MLTIFCFTNIEFWEGEREREKERERKRERAYKKEHIRITFISILVS